MVGFLTSSVDRSPFEARNRRSGNAPLGHDGFLISRPPNPKRNSGTAPRNCLLSRPARSPTLAVLFTIARPHATSRSDPTPSADLGSRLALRGPVQRFFDRKRPRTLSGALVRDSPGQRWLDLSPEVRRRELAGENPRVDGGKRNVFVHQFLSSDDDRALHDHPWPWMTLILEGEYLEHLPADASKPSGETIVHRRRAGDIVIRRNASRPHRIELLEQRPATTLFVTGRKRREWGFHRARGWRHWREFTAANGRGGSRGCE